MAHISSLLNKLPAFKDSRMVANGFGVWVSWKKEMNQAVAHALQDYGGMVVIEDQDQALWFFFTSDVFSALARLAGWGKMNPMPMLIEVMQAKILIGYKLEVSISIEEGLAKQDSGIPEEFTILIHPRAKERAEQIPGLSFQPYSKVEKLAPAGWLVLQADQRLPFPSTLGWYVILKPLGNPLDKAFQFGWREFFTEIERIIAKMKLKYILHDNFLMFQLDSIRQLRNWCTDFLTMVARIKEESPDKHWPTVMAVVEKKGFNFNNELPKRIRLDWNMLMPDFPHMSYRSAFLLSDGFKINDVRFSMDQSSVDDWCNISLEGEFDHNQPSLPIEMPKFLVAGEYQTCFYCGLRSHMAVDCPSRQLKTWNPTIWEKVSRLNLEDINKALGEVDDILVKERTAGLVRLLEADSTPGVLVQAIFEINAPVQLRLMRMIWRSQGKDYPRGLEQLGTEESSTLLQAMDQLLHGEAVTADRMLYQALLKAPLNYQTRTLQGFTALERGDLIKAAFYWKEAEPQCTTSLQRSYHIYLQGRVMEMEGRFQQAQELYRKVLQHTPRWFDAQYRVGVCLVKMGFAEQAMHVFEELLTKDPHMFNRILLDPELERGHLHLRQALVNPWTAAETRAQEERQNLEALRSDLAKWFEDEHPFAQEVTERAQRLDRLGQVNNYVAFLRLASGRQELNQDVDKRIEEESRHLKMRFQAYMERLRNIRREASWFPFPRILIEFNRDFNFCAKNLNWAMRQHFTLAENFRRARQMSNKVRDTIKNLESRLKTLKVIRDSTLFLLIMAKTFFWMEMAGLLLSLVIMPLSMFYAKEMGYQWAKTLTSQQSWDLQKGLIIILSISALGLAALRTAVVFDKKKEKLLEKLEKR